MVIPCIVNACRNVRPFSCLSVCETLLKWMLVKPAKALGESGPVAAAEQRLCAALGKGEPLRNSSRRVTWRCCHGVLTTAQLAALCLQRLGFSSSGGKSEVMSSKMVMDAIIRSCVRERNEHVRWWEETLCSNTIKKTTIKQPCSHVFFSY